MDTIKSFKGYGKVDEAEERAFRAKTRKRMIIIIASIVVLATVIIGAVAGTLIHRNNNESSSSSTPSSTSPAQSIKAVCSVTQYPDSCFSSISSSAKLSSSNNNQKLDVQEIFKLSLQIAADELTKISSLPDKLIANSNDLRSKSALIDCKSLFEDAIDQINSSISSMQVKSVKDFLSSSKIDDIKTWLSSAITDQETCLDGLDEMKSPSHQEVKTAMKNSTEFTSNSLAIGSKILTLLKNFDIPIHRKLLGFPTWVNPNDRRLLQEVTPVPDLTVASDGTGNFTTIQDAIDSLKKKNKERTVIYVKAGTYLENVIIDKAYWNIMMYGDGKAKTIVSASLNNVDGTPTFSSGTFVVTGQGFMARDMGFINTAGPEKHQAVALRSGSDRSIFYRCTFDAYQDTLYAHTNRQFYRECDIIGTIDFIFGNAAAVFQNCLIQPRQPMVNQFNTITAQGKKDPNQITGISIQKCVIAPLGDVKARTYLGRPWKDFSTTVIMETDIGGFVEPQGWLPWIANVDPPSTIFYGEYMNIGAGAGLEKRVNWTGYHPILDIGDAQKFTVESFIQGTVWLQEANVVFDSSL